MTLSAPDVEKLPATAASISATSSASDSRPVVKSTGILARLRHYEQILDEKLGVESQGAERVLPSCRNDPPSQWVMFALWASGTMNLSCFATGFLGWEFGLSLKQSILVVIFGTFLGSCVVSITPRLPPEVTFVLSVKRWLTLRCSEQTGWCATMGELIPCASRAKPSQARPHGCGRRKTRC